MKEKKSEESTSKIRPSPLLVSVQDFDPAGHFALSIKRKWILNEESNDCKCIWDMDEEEDNVQAVLDDVNEDMKSVEPSLHSAFPNVDVEREVSSRAVSQLSAKTIRLSLKPESVEVIENNQEQQVKGKEKASKKEDKKTEDVDAKAKKDKDKKKVQEVMPKEEKSTKHTKKEKPIKIMPQPKHPVEIAKINKVI